MVKVDAVELALKTLKFDRFEKVYVAKLRMRVSEKTLATRLGTSIPNVRVRIVKARRGALKKVIHHCRSRGKLQPERMRGLVLAAGLQEKKTEKLFETFKAFLGTRWNSEEQIEEVDSFLTRVFKSEKWTDSIAWRNKKIGMRQAKSRIRERHEKRYSAGVTKKISWEEVGEGVLNDTQKGSATWEHWRSVMSRRANDTEKKSLLNMLGSEMELLYGRYRRARERKEGKAGRYHCFGSEKRQARQVAEHCLMRDVHPVELLQYWDDNISNFTDQRYPTLAFLKGAYAVDGFSSRKKETKPQDGNSYSNVDDLHPRFRRILENAGFRTQRYPDRMLKSIQYMASLKRRGIRFYIDSKSDRKMIEWAADHWVEIFGS